ncbi:MAG: TRAP transporter small permease [Candidatus Auribacterota bacterium]|nr:TRAP transporter small permease [Candidatus Auribacterota bacterium]
MKGIAALNRGIKYIETFILSLSIISLAVVTVGNVISRKLFNFSWTFAEEVSQFIMVLITFMGISYAARRARHIRMTAIFDNVPDKIKKAMMLLVSLITAATLFYLAYYSIVYLLDVRATGRVTPVLRIPFYLVIISVPLGFFLGGIQFSLTFLKNIMAKEVWLSSEEKAGYKEIGCYDL